MKMKIKPIYKKNKRSNTEDLVYNSINIAAAILKLDLNNIISNSKGSFINP